jgi:hypothetical protein
MIILFHTVTTVYIRRVHTFSKEWRRNKRELHAQELIVQIYLDNQYYYILVFSGPLGTC